MSHDETAREAGHDAVGQRSETVRRANLSAIVRELHARGPQSRSELVARTGLTRSAIRGLIGEFVTADLVSEERSAPAGAPGRPSPIVSPRPDGAVVVALDVAVDSLSAAVVGLGGDVIEQIVVDRPRGHLAVEEIVDDLAELAGRLGALRSRRRGVLIGVGVAVVGVVRRTDGLVSMAPNLGWRDVPLGARIEAALGLGVPVTVANEADLGAIAELRRGAARGADNLLYISGDVGVGGGIIVDGKPLTGVAGYAGEVGHLPMNPDGVRCHCGSTGCWETEVGERALLSRAGRDPEGGSKEVDALIVDATAGSEAALGAIEATGRWIGVGLAGLVNVLNPRVIVLGGLFSRIHPFARKAIEAELDRLALPGPRSLVRVAPAQLGPDAPLIGAAELAFEPFLADPASWLGPRDLLAVGA